MKQNYTIESWYNTFSTSTGTRFEVEGNPLSLFYPFDFGNTTAITIQNAFTGLFKDCTGLTSAGNLLLPATTLANYSYKEMFSGCTSLTGAPALPATTLTIWCYRNMFQGCTSLTAAPSLPATTLQQQCYQYMFSGCTSLSGITCLATNPATGYTEGWVNGVAATGTFVKVHNASWETGVNGIPSGWTVFEDGFNISTNHIYMQESGDTTQIIVIDYFEGLEYDWTATTDNWITISQNTGGTGITTLTITAAAASAPRKGSVVFDYSAGTVTLQVTQNDNFYKPLTFNIISGGTITWSPSNNYYSKSIQYSLDNGETWTATSGKQTITVSAGDKVQFRGNNSAYGGTVSSSTYRNYFSASDGAKYEVEGNIMSLITSTGFTTAKTLTSNYTFYNMFGGDDYNYAKGLVSAENLILPATKLAQHSYENMFLNCTGLTKSPELPEATLNAYCYRKMFRGCRSLTAITCLATSVSAYQCTQDWVNGVASSGTFVTPSSTNWSTGNNGIPSGWTRINA